jgi:uncharacterized membrane-anchored protein YhcB (DUF1043 family)
MNDLVTIKNQLSTKDLFEAFRKQLQKDFDQCNYSADFVKTLEPDYGSIHEKIMFELQNKKKSDFNLRQLLYRIDISESQLVKHLNEYKNENYFGVLADLIIKRVLQKVVIKQYYKSKENS